MKSVRRDLVAESYQQYRTAKHLTNKEVATRAGLSQGSMTSINKDPSLYRGKFVKIDTIRKLGKGLGFSQDKIQSWLKALKNGDENGFLIHPINRSTAKNLPQPEVARAINDMLNRRHMTINELGQKSGLNPQTISKMKSLTSKNRPETVRTRWLLKLSKGFGFNREQANKWIDGIGNNAKPSLPSTYNQEHVAKDLTKFMKQLGINGPTLAKKAGLGVSTLYRIKSLKASNKPDFISLSSLKQLGRGLGLSSIQCHQWAMSIANPDKYSFDPTKPKQDQEQNNDDTPDNSDTNSPLSTALKQIMSEHQLSLSQIIAKSGLNGERLQDVYDGKIKTMPRLSALRLAQSLNISPKPLIDASQQSEQKQRAVAETNQPKPQEAPRQLTEKEAMRAYQGVHTQSSESSQTSLSSTNADLINNNTSTASNSSNTESPNNQQPTKAKLKLLDDKSKDRTPNLPPKLEKAMINHFAKVYSKKSMPKENRPKPSLQFRPIVRHAIKDLNKLSSADVSIIDLLIQRMLNAHYHD